MKVVFFFMVLCLVGKVYILFEILSILLYHIILYILYYQRTSFLVYVVLVHGSEADAESLLKYVKDMWTIFFFLSKNKSPKTLQHFPTQTAPLT